ncbi:16S rRNA (guanine(966)-N(2))-methyltransferase RsmD [Azospira restricta]|uniref:16S rRNA (Guanine(966)-N(2))-methyltransferase RsmD n=1 Tax=Azospira restricta TaxID=404405 RepID=A0A974SPE1_9RHOO|nr:16S rRNA (guanine(966)-N(2))-methyltransferase RsmD [Azospira restricta]QRJ64021.1 16S rRNA (guanine(966)-N(2))-methyltransferase RsmD [Azospira restricta]
MKPPGKRAAADGGGQLRIIGGEWRRRVLRFPGGEGLRPTPDRVRETLFNWLGQELSGLSCLDLFAGSGALGLEAASRGADRVVLVEREPKAAAALAANVRLLGAGGKVELVCQDALKFAVSTPLAFDVIFLDPPYRQGWIEKLCPLLPRLANPDAVLYVEAESPQDGIGDWRTVRRGQAGQVFYHLMRRESPQDAESSRSDLPGHL